ncbi:MAG: restriction endonuclease [Candidatus Onthomorpha sp.]|nr:restriction endonuclease [Bacteroidales bacterium]MDD7485331.1 restriction endonuclease [Bacteroidales bacterium]MDY5698748.1 restriction endonuclease [Candidatus Onthomorpha sp.]
MRILIEEYQYEVADVKDILHGIDPLTNIEGKVSIHYVGYYYNSLLRDCVFILPKVLLQGNENSSDGKELVFGRYKPEEIANLDEKNPLSKKERDFIYKFAVWIYRAIVVYKNDKQTDSSIIYYAQIAQIGKGQRRLSNTYLDILLSLIQFNRENQNFFFFVLKNLHSGLNKINWTRTIGTTTAIVQRNRPIYLNPINKKRQINFDEELLVIFFSILNYIGDTYGFSKEINCQFDLIKGKMFETYLKGYGKTRLLQIKYKYFSDKALELWRLCFAFFDESRQIFINTEQKEYLLVKNFYIVFEAIIDELIGDKPLPDGMEKKQGDGKIVDHLFSAPSLIDGKAKQTYYIGDSKYYKIDHELSSESIYKQYTYARNVIQWNLDIFNDGRESDVRLRDEVTEGYNIIPNFFISAKMDKEFDYSNDGIEKTDRKKNKHKQIQFKNRLFDRDTLLLFHYDVNFLFVLSLYARNNTSQKAKWKNDIRNKFRKEIQDWLQKDYEFYAMRARPGVDSEEYIRHNFKQVVGKIYTPFSDDKTYSLALDNNDPEGDNKEILSALSEFFYVKPCNLGQNPDEVLPATANQVAIKSTERDLALCVTKEGIHFDNAVAKMKLTGKLGIALNMNGATLQLVEGFTTAKYIIIHNKSNKYAAFFVDGKGPKLISANEMTDMVTTKKDSSVYLVYNARLDIVPAFGELDFTPIAKSGDSYSPHLLSIRSLIKAIIDA